MMVVFAHLVYVRTSTRVESQPVCSLFHLYVSIVHMHALAVCFVFLCHVLFFVYWFHMLLTPPLTCYLSSPGVFLLFLIFQSCVFCSLVCVFSDSKIASVWCKIVTVCLPEPSTSSYSVLLCCLPDVSDMFIMLVTGFFLIPYCPAFAFSVVLGSLPCFSRKPKNFHCVVVLVKERMRGYRSTYHTNMFIVFFLVSTVPFIIPQF